MKIAIISDTHDNIPNIEKALKYFKKQKVSAIIHCGDIFNKDTVKYIADNFKGECYLLISADDAHYLYDIDDLKKNEKLHFYNDYGQFKIEKAKIGFTHFPEYIYKLAKENPDYIFYGHTHQPQIEPIHFTHGKCIVTNPGNLAGIFYQATFAILDTKTNKLELKIMEKIK